MQIKFNVRGFDRAVIDNGELTLELRSIEGPMFHDQYHRALVNEFGLREAEGILDKAYEFTIRQVALKMME